MMTAKKLMWVAMTLGLMATGLAAIGCDDPGAAKMDYGIAKTINYAWPIMPLQIVDAADYVVWRDN